MNNRILFAICTFALCLCGIARSHAQELNCKVKVLHDKIQNVDQQVFTDMERAISSFINTRKWTTDEFSATEKIDCTIMFNLVSRDPASELYGATMNIQSTRPVFNTGFSTSLVNFVDREVTFKFNQFSPLTFDDNRVSGNDPNSDNLTAILAYYVYWILGLDYDSFSPSGGNVYYKKAQNIVTNAPESKNIGGWRPAESNKNRYWLVDQVLNPRFSEFRKYWYTMHRMGFDIMYDKPNEGRQNILAGLAMLNKLNKENPNSILLQFFFNAKSTDLMNLLSDVPVPERTAYITLLSQTDVTNANKYQQLLRQ
jgi:hypothetical protein